MNDAHAALESGDFAAAQRLLLDYLRGHAADPDASAMLGAVLNLTGRSEKAIRLLRPQLKRDPLHAALRRELAFAYIACARLDGAVETLAPMFARKLDSLDVRRLFERSLSSLGRLARKPDVPYAPRNVWQDLGRTLLALGDRGAAELCDQAAYAEEKPAGHYSAFDTGMQLEEYCAGAGYPIRVLPGIKVEPPPGGSASAMPPLDSFVAALPGGMSLGRSFIPATADGKAFIERCIPNVVKHMQTGAVEALDTVRLGSMSRLLACSTGTDAYRGRHVLLGSHENVGHWFYFHFGRLRLIDELPELADAPLVVGDDLRPALRDSLLRAGIAPERIVGIPRGRFARFDELWVPSMLFGGTPRVLCWNPGLARYIRARLGLEFGAPRTRRLFIGRAGARWRRLVNETEIIDALAEFGFESIDPGAMSLEQQIETAAGAEIIVSAFGAGTNLHLFAPETAPLVELKFDAQAQMDIHPIVAEDIGQPHRSVMGEIRRRDATLLHSDFAVSPAAVRAAVVKALEASGA